MRHSNKSKKILALFLLLMFGFVIFLAVMLYTALHKRDIPSIYSEDTAKAQRGSIISADGFHIATTQKLYKAVVNTRNIDPGKEELFVQLFSIYSGMDPKEIKERLHTRKGSVTLSYHISPKEAMYLKTLAFELRRLGVFIEYETPNGDRILQGLNILESGEARQYPYGNLLTPLLGYPRKIEEDGYTRVYGIKGLEKFFDEELNPQQNKTQKALRDVNGYLILNKQSDVKRQINGLTVKLNIPILLQSRVEIITDQIKQKLQADEIIATVMESKTGKIIALASSNRFDPNHIRVQDYPSLNANVIEYSYEPGSVIKPIIFSLMLDRGLINPYDMVNGHNGRFTMGTKTIVDEHAFSMLSAEDVLVYSSNIGIAQLAQKLNGVEFTEGLKRFGFTHFSGIDLPYEKRGSVPSSAQLNNYLYKAITAYGYGMRANPMQLVKAFNVFNNGGKLINPMVVEALYDDNGRIIPMQIQAPTQVIAPATAERMKQILIKTVNVGTGTIAKTPGLEVGGKTGTAHIAKNGAYVNSYHTSFIGFANDSKHNYTIGITVIEPRTVYFASITAVPVFKAIVDLMVEEKYLTPDPAAAAAASEPSNAESTHL
ncbi:Peptidoglycan glycosyltransferase [Sulfuricurvum kujiense DSM 16994]|uniref:Peptidoglycan glycosyltransferase n=1 Tax=Sulfuricurvum kujiense (strain ATCC BAA-921 / DSM 16994 / JCM 11577 / YK-1) TaxID=709032 RepID=E4TX45_SULKY|nr:penicillin-binding protein 2 [Sulfuricurvum kujiense]ADR34911.1 Peptidoglycan glycosyltransferase [Sulfuricurvum kujiense DSM 16994]